MPSVQMYLKDHPESVFTGNYYIADPDANDTATKTWFEIQKERQPAEALGELKKGDVVVFVSPDGEAEELLFINETESHLIFSSQI